MATTIADVFQPATFVEYEMVPCDAVRDDDVSLIQRMIQVDRESAQRIESDERIRKPLRMRLRADKTPRFLECCWLAGLLMSTDKKV